MKMLKLASLYIMTIIAACSMPDINVDDILNPPTITTNTPPTIGEIPPNLKPTSTGELATDAIVAETPPAVAGVQNPPVEIQQTFLPQENQYDIFHYIVQVGTPVYSANFIYPGLGCGWMGVGGQVFDLASQPVLNLVVEIGGTLNGIEISQVGLTGTTKSLGPGGYDVKLADRVIASQNSVWIQVKDLTGTPQSDILYFNTFADCEKSLVLINFTEVNSPRTHVILPQVFYDYCAISSYPGPCPTPFLSSP